MYRYELNKAYNFNVIFRCGGSSYSSYRTVYEVNEFNEVYEI